MPAYPQAIGYRPRSTGQPEASNRAPTHTQSRSAGHQRRPRCGGRPCSEAKREHILTMEPPGTAVRTAIFPGHARPWVLKLSVLLRRGYVFTFEYLSPSGYHHGMLIDNLPRIARTPGPQPSRTPTPSSRWSQGPCAPCAPSPIPLASVRSPRPPRTIPLEKGCTCLTEDHTSRNPLFPRLDVIP
jgi:hypothetical protein